MLKYADADFYENEYGGTDIPSDVIEGFLVRSSRAIDRATYHRIGDLSRWPSFTQRQIMLATCAEAENIYVRAGDRGALESIGSYTIGDVSVSVKNDTKPSDSLAKHFELSEDTIGYLLPTGLLYRRI